VEGHAVNSLLGLAGQGGRETHAVPSRRRQEWVSREKALQARKQQKETKRPTTQR
jgi:hypothetical protein